MKISLAAVTCLLACATAQAQAVRARGNSQPWAGYDRGVRWERDLDRAKEIAAKTGKPLLCFELVGDLDADGC